MCFKRKPPPAAWQPSPRIALLFGINNYPGTGNDLNGCLNDIDLVKTKLTDFQIREFRDECATRAAFREQLTYAIINAKAGDVIYIHYSGHGTYVSDPHGDEADGYDEAICLHDGTFTDDDFQTILQGIPYGVRVIISLDSCFSGSATRDMTVKPRFLPPKKPFTPGKRIKKAIRTGQNYIVLSGCGEHQTSADAIINGEWNGAYTYYAMMTLHRSDTYNDWFDKISLYLPSKTFEQKPTIEGDEELLNRIIFT